MKIETAPLQSFSEHDRGLSYRGDRSFLKTEADMLICADMLKSLHGQNRI